MLSSQLHKIAPGTLTWWCLLSQAWSCPDRGFLRTRERCQRGEDWQGDNVRHSRQEWPCGLPESPLQGAEVWVPKGHRPLQLLTSKAPLAQKHAKIRSQCQPYLANKGKVGLGQNYRTRETNSRSFQQASRCVTAPTTRRQNPVTNSDLSPTSGSAPLPGGEPLKRKREGSCDQDICSQGFQCNRDARKDQLIESDSPYVVSVFKSSETEI